MEAKVHEFYNQHLRKFNVLRSMLAEFSKDLPTFEAELMQQENDFTSYDSRVKTRQAELEAIEKRIRERSALSDRSFSSLKEQLQKMKAEIDRREVELKLKEQIVNEKQKKVDELLLTVEMQAEKASGGRKFKVGV